MEEVIRFELRARDGGAARTLTDDAIRDGVRDGRIAPGTRVRLEGTAFWAPVEAWATFSARRVLPTVPPAPIPDEVTSALPEELAGLPAHARDMLLFWLDESEHTFGPLTGEQIRRGFLEGRYGAARVAVVAMPGWYDAAPLFAPRAVARSAAGASSALFVETRSCPTCLESIPASSEVCPECLEPVASPPSTSRPASVADDVPDASFLRMHWRPIVTLGAMMLLICTGVALRYLAPNRWFPPKAASSHPSVVTPACTTPCWSGEACQIGQCVWQAPKDVRHVSPEPLVGGPFALPKDVSDVLPLDGERFGAALLAGLEVRSARTGEVIGLVSEAPQSRKLYRVGDVVYDASPQRIYVIDAQSTKLLKTIEVGSLVGDLALGVSGRRALVSLPSAHAVAILATEFHAEIDRIQFGDDVVGPVGTDETGRRALTTTGQVPLPGLREPPGGAVYAFDPSRLASNQDRVRASVVGNPVSVLMTPDGEASWVVVRAGDALVPLEWLPSGAVRERERVATCHEPEQIELVHKDRRALVRCDAGRALEVFDLATNKLLRHIPFNARAVDMALSPDGAQALVALTGEGNGTVAVVDLDTYAVKLVPLSGEPSRVRYSPDGGTAIAFSERSKAAWVLK